MMGADKRLLMIRRSVHVPDVGFTTPTENIVLSSDDVDALTVALERELPEAGTDRSTLEKVLRFLETGNNEPAKKEEDEKGA